MYVALKTASKHQGVCTVWHRISIPLLHCVYARTTRAPAVVRVSRGPLVIYCHPIRLLPGVSRAEGSVHRGSDKPKEGNGEKRAVPRKSRTLLDRLPVDIKLNQIPGWTKPARIRSVAFKRFARQLDARKGRSSSLYTQARFIFPRLSRSHRYVLDRLARARRIFGKASVSWQI